MKKRNSLIQQNFSNRTMKPSSQQETARTAASENQINQKFTESYRDHVRCLQDIENKLILSIPSTPNSTKNEN